MELSSIELDELRYRCSAQRDDELVPVAAGELRALLAMIPEPERREPLKPFPEALREIRKAEGWPAAAGER